MLCNGANSITYFGLAQGIVLNFIFCRCYNLNHQRDMRWTTPDVYLMSVFSTCSWGPVHLNRWNQTGNNHMWSKGGQLGEATRSVAWQILVDKYSGDFFYRKSTIETTKAAIEASNGTYCLRKRIEKFPLNIFELGLAFAPVGDQDQGNNLPFVQGSTALICHRWLLFVLNHLPDQTVNHILGDASTEICYPISTVWWKHFIFIKSNPLKLMNFRFK